MNEDENTIIWETKGTIYKIHKVPTLQCIHEDCLDTYHTANVEINLSILAEKMEQNEIPNEIEYYEVF